MESIVDDDEVDFLIFQIDSGARIDFEAQVRARLLAELALGGLAGDVERAAQQRLGLVCAIGPLRPEARLNPSFERRRVVAAHQLFSHGQFVAVIAHGRLGVVDQRMKTGRRGKADRNFLMRADE